MASPQLEEDDQEGCRTASPASVRFRADEDCLDYLKWLRWPGGFTCPSCGHAGGWAMGDGRFECAACHRRTSVTEGTIFDRTRTPLTVWFTACWLFATQKDRAPVTRYLVLHSTPMRPESFMERLIGVSLEVRADEPCSRTPHSTRRARSAADRRRAEGPEAAAD